MGTWRGVELEGPALAEPAPGSLRLRPYRADDVPAALAGAREPAMHAFLPLPDPYTEDDARRWCTDTAPGRARHGAGLELVITDGDDRMVGGAGVRLPTGDGVVAEVGYSVHGAARGRHLAARAARLLTGWAFAHGVARVEIRAAVGNLASVRSALHAGFRFETLCRGGQRTPRGVADGAVLARVASDTGDPVRPWLPPLVDVGDDVVWLRPVTADDAGALAADMRDPTSRRWAVGTPPSDADAAAAVAATRAALGWFVGPSTRVAVVDRGTGAVAGLLEIRAGGPPGVLELGYGVLPAHRGRGITARALPLLAAWLFERAGVARLELGADVDNGASRTVAERAGFRPEGVAAGRLRRADGSFADEVRYGMTSTA